MKANLISLWSTWSWRSIWTLWEWGTGSLRHNVGHRSRESFPKTYLISFHPWGATFSFPTLQHGEREREWKYMSLSCWCIYNTSHQAFFCETLYWCFKRIIQDETLSLFADKLHVDNSLSFSQIYLPFLLLILVFPAIKEERINHWPSNEHINKKYIHNNFRVIYQDIVPLDPLILDVHLNLPLPMDKTERSVLNQIWKHHILPKIRQK